MVRWYGKDDNCGDWFADLLSKVLRPRVYTDSNGAQRKGFDALQFRDIATKHKVRLPWPPTDKTKMASWAANGRRKLATAVAERGSFTWKDIHYVAPKEWVDKILERKSNVSEND